MALPRYLAQTSEEIAACSPLPKQLAWMACHFSPYGTGLTNLPPALPAGSMIILNDRIPFSGHDPYTVIRQLEALSPDCLLLDLLRPPEEKSLEMVRRITESLPCAVGVPPDYGFDLHCPLFLALPRPDEPLAEHLIPWSGREIWLELERQTLSYTITEDGAVPGPVPNVPKNGQYDEDLCCHYHIAQAKDRVDFTLWRTHQDLDALLEKAQVYGVTKAIGLWQELG